MLRFMEKNLREQYEKAQQLGKLAFAERPYFGSPAAPAQAETNASQIWGHINAGYLIAYEYTRWWKESAALRNAAVIGDWSWLNKTRVHGRDAARLMDYATVKDLSKQQVGQIVYTPMVNENGKVAIEGLTLKLAEDEYLFTQSAGLKWLEFLRQKTGLSESALLQRAEILVVTRGEDGSSIIRPTTRVDVPAVPVRKIVDPTGVGDAYRAGLMKGLVHGADDAAITR